MPYLCLLVSVKCDMRLNPENIGVMSSLGHEGLCSMSVRVNILVGHVELYTLLSVPEGLYVLIFMR